MAESMSADSAPRPSALVVKLGGAAISDKHVSRTLRGAELSKLAEFLSSVAWRTAAQLAVIHGAGSFGHIEAKRHKLNSSAPDAVERKRAAGLHGLAACRASLAALNSIVLDALLDAGLPATQVSVFPRAAHLEAQARDTLDAGGVPVMHGDVLLDDEAHTQVISGDEIALRLAALLLQQHSATAGASAVPPAVCSSHESPSEVAAPSVAQAVTTSPVPPVRVVFATGAAGVFDCDPSTHTGATVFRVIGVRPRPSDRDGACRGDSSLEPGTVAPAYELVRWIARADSGLSSSAPCPRCGASGGSCGRLTLFDERGSEGAASEHGAASAAAASAEGSSAGAADVTGGMAGKLRAAISIALLSPSTAAAPELRSRGTDPSDHPRARDLSFVAGIEVPVLDGPRVHGVDSSRGSCFCQTDVDPSAPVASIVGVDAAVLSAVFDAHASLADVLAAEGTHVVRLRS